MQLAISNLAWESEEDDELRSAISELRVTGIEIAPTKVWSNPINVDNNQIKIYRRYWNSHGIEIVSLQSLLFGRPDLTIFSNEQKRQETLEYLSRVIELGANLGAKIFVFGSPKNRLVGNMKHTTAMDIAIDFFHRLGEIANKFSVIFCIEPNPEFYGCDFIKTTQEGIELVKEVNHPGFQLHLDTAAMTLSNENIKSSLEYAVPYLKHFHISEPNLQMIKLGVINHGEIAKYLEHINYDKYISIEMRAGLNSSNLTTVKKCLEFVKKVYLK